MPRRPRTGACQRADGVVDEIEMRPRHGERQERLPARIRRGGANRSGHPVKQNARGRLSARVVVCPGTQCPAAQAPRCPPVAIDTGDRLAGSHQRGVGGAFVLSCSRACVGKSRRWAPSIAACGLASVLHNAIHTDLQDVPLYCRLSDPGCCGAAVPPAVSAGGDMREGTSKLNAGPGGLPRRDVFKTATAATALMGAGGLAARPKTAAARSHPRAATRSCAAISGSGHPWRFLRWVLP